jgi:hypothetical protein
MLRLEKEQEELISILVESARKMPREQRQSFFAYWPGSGTEMWMIKHRGLPGGTIQVHLGDLEVLYRHGLLTVMNKNLSDWRFDVHPTGFAYYEEMKKRAGQAVQRMEAEVRSYLDAASFRSKYPESYAKWASAESKLWGCDSAEQLTTIGHLCRESMQEFAKALIEMYKPKTIDPIVAHTKNRIRSVINARSERLGDTEKPFLDTLISYWDSIDDLVQRQEHGAQKEGKPLLWEDGRRLVFQTAIVMFEIDKALSRG